ncbi:hypothetical protein H4W80_009024 [Nonomuraea angiospora]|uniref:Uncharacterized protein n=1 Tax=Nonomuraea angiospora TaxID=46172 RepID=A0ABR9MCW9_9ACTN|nr:hypothetical protein [Nonomuraea angiospora]
MNRRIGPAQQHGRDQAGAVGCGGSPATVTT